jgi:dihydrofolate reductase
MPLHEVHAYAIVSADGMIADASGEMPDELKNDADWAYFQSQLDLSELVIVGRRSHEAAPSTGRRRRVVLSGSVASLEQRRSVWWWNPSALPLSTLLEQLLPAGGRVAVPGGQGVFDFLARERAIDRFHLSRALSVRLPGGHPAFSAQADGTPLDHVLGEQGLHPGPTLTIDAHAPVVLTVWHRRPPQADRTTS